MVTMFYQGAVIKYNQGVFTAVLILTNNLNFFQDF